MSNQIKFGSVKFKSIAAAAKAAQKKNPALSYMTIYMRLRAGKKVGSALQAKPRTYVRRVVEQPVEATV